MTTRISTDRSRILTHQECHRRRWLAYHEGPEALGIASVHKPLPLAVGGSVHVGNAHLLEHGSALYSLIGADSLCWMDVRWRQIEDAAVAAALADFAQFSGGKLEIDLYESSQQTSPDGAALDEQLAASLGMTPADAGLASLSERVGKARSEFEEFLYAEQSALVEAMVRAYARRRLRPLLEQYEVLEVEREGSWLLGEVGHAHGYGCWDADGNVICKNPLGLPMELWFMSRPDALLLERDTRQLSILSFKTTASWDIRKERDASHDMQGLTEGVEVERRLAEWWDKIHTHKAMQFGGGEGPTPALADYLAATSAPPRIAAIRYEFLLKGQRRHDKDLSARLSLKAYSQASPLVHGYLSAGMAAGDEQWNWSWDYVKETGESSKLYWKAWRGTPVWEHMPIRQWIDLLDSTHETVGEEGASRGWSGPAQATGFTTAHPLDSVFLPPVVIYRNDDDLRDCIEQIEAQERRVAESVALVRAAADEGERRHLLNVHFEQFRKSCEYPSTCAYTRICFGGEDIRRDPLGSGLYQIRTVNHPQEVQR